MITLRFPDKIAYGSRRRLISGATRLVRRADGSIASANSEHAGAGIRVFDLQQAIQGRTDFDQVQAFHLNARGMGREFRFKDHWDYQATSEDLDISGGTRFFQLRKAYWLTSDPPGIDVVSLGNFAADATIGTAAATVDVAALIKINQSTASKTLTLPDPTDTTAGRMIQIANIGTRPFTMLSTQCEPRTARSALWDGSAWAFVGEVEQLYVIYRKIRKPVLGTVTLYLNGVAVDTISSNLIPANALTGIGYETFNSQLFNESVTLSGVEAAIDYESGEIQWLTDSLPVPGVDVLSATFQFDIRARFNSDEFPSAIRNYEAFENSFEIIEQVSAEDISAT